MSHPEIDLQKEFFLTKEKKIAIGDFINNIQSIVNQKTEPYENTAVLSFLSKNEQEFILALRESYGLAPPESKMALSNKPPVLPPVINFNYQENGETRPDDDAAHGGESELPLFQHIYLIAYIVAVCAYARHVSSLQPQPAQVEQKENNPDANSVIENQENDEEIKQHIQNKLFSFPDANDDQYFYWHNQNNQYFWIAAACVLISVIVLTAFGCALGGIPLFTTIFLNAATPVWGALAATVGVISTGAGIYCGNEAIKSKKIMRLYDFVQQKKDLEKIAEEAGFPQEKNKPGQ